MDKPKSEKTKITLCKGILTNKEISCVNVLGIKKIIVQHHLEFRILYRDLEKKLVLSSPLEKEKQRKIEDCITKEGKEVGKIGTRGTRKAGKVQKEGKKPSIEVQTKEAEGLGRNTCKPSQTLIWLAIH